MNFPNEFASLHTSVKMEARGKMSMLFCPLSRRGRRSLLFMLLATGLLALASPVSAQAPAVPPVPAVPTAPGVAPTTIPAAPAAPANLWSFLCPSEDQKAACKAKLCKLPITQLANNMMAPVSLFSGGLFSGCCPTGPSAQDLAAPADSAEGAAARIQQSEAEAKKRRLTVRYLGTVDCRYWPEAEAALITALRSDPNECVRWEAAHALTSGCCCTKPIIDALVLSVSGSDKDHHPAETSPRVREQAQMALDHCLSRYTQVVTPPESNQRPEKPEQPRPTTLPTPEMLPAAYVPAAPAPVAQHSAPAYVPPPLGQQSLYDVAMHAAISPEPPLAEPAPTTHQPPPTGQRNLLSIMSRSLTSGQ